MDSALQVKEGIEKRAEYHYDAFGNRRGQDIYSRPAGSGIPDTGAERPQDPEQQVRYTLDITRRYHNLLVSEDYIGQKSRSFYWDGNVAAMEEAGRDSYYLQDDLGSPMQLVGENGEIRESYGFDEFGQPLHDGEQQLQPFGFTGYQMEAAGGLYFAQARRYDAGAGRFVSEDSVRGSVTAPFTLNRYTYCWGDPVRLVDLDGRDPTGTDINELIDSVKRDFLQDMIRSAEQVYDGLVLKANKACDAALDTIESACDVVAETAEVAFHTIVESARSAYHTAAGAVQDAYHTRVEILKTTASSIKKFAVEFYNEHKKVIDTIVKVLITVEIGAVSVLAALAAATAAPEGLAATAVIALCGTILTAGGVGGLVGGLSNEMTGGSFLNGFCGGFSNACIATAVATMGFPGLGNFLGGFVGNEVTESFNNMDIEDPAAQKDQSVIHVTSALMGVIQIMTGKGPIGDLGKGAGMSAGTAEYFSAQFFGQNLTFMISGSGYILISNMVEYVLDIIGRNPSECVE